MIITRNKNTKSETSSRHLPNTHKITHLVGIAKKSDPLLRDLTEAQDKENLNPNREHRVKSHHYKNEQRSPKQKNNSKTGKSHNNHNHQAYYATKPIQSELNSSGKGNYSAELQRPSKTSNRKSTEKDEPLMNHFQE